MRRVVAVLGAVLMVGVALLVRGALSGDDDSDDGGSDGESGSEVTLLCADELQDVCRALADSGAIEGFDVEAAGDTVDRLADDEELGADAWLTLDPFPEMADVGRDEAGHGPVFDDPLGTGYGTDSAAVLHPGRADEFGAACGEIDWPCLGELAGDQWAEHGGEQAWGEIKVGIEDPDSASGLLVATEAVAAHLGIDDFITNDLDQSDADRWIGRFDTGDNVLGRLVTQGAGAFSAVGALGIEARDLAQTAQGEDLAIFYPAPMFRSEVVVVAPGTSADDLLDGDDLDEALAGAGWEEGGSSELPSAGAIYALRESL